MIKIKSDYKTPSHPYRISPIFNTTQIATPQHLTKKNTIKGRVLLMVFFAKNA